MKKLRLGKMTQLAPGHTDWNYWQSKDSNPGVVAPSHINAPHVHLCGAVVMGPSVFFRIISTTPKTFLLRLSLESCPLCCGDPRSGGAQLGHGLSPLAVSMGSWDWNVSINLKITQESHQCLDFLVIWKTSPWKRTGFCFCFCFF